MLGRVRTAPDLVVLGLVEGMVDVVVGSAAAALLGGNATPPSDSSSDLSADRCRLRDFFGLESPSLIVLWGARRRARAFDIYRRLRASLCVGMEMETLLCGACGEL